MEPGTAAPGLGRLLSAPANAPSRGGAPAPRFFLLALQSRPRHSERVMEWNDEGVVLSTRPHGETGVIAEILTRERGRRLGFVRGGRSKRLAPVLQTANRLAVSWRARLPEQLGAFQVELLAPHAARILDDPLALTAATSLCALSRLLPECAPCPLLYDALDHVLSRLDSRRLWPALIPLWELALLAELGFGLDLGSCAATGARRDLAYVSPRSGQAVSALAGAPYREKLLRLPPYLCSSDGGAPHRAPDAIVPAPTPPELQDVIDALALTRYFLEKRVLAPIGARLPEARQRLPNLILRAERREGR